MSESHVLTEAMLRESINVAAQVIMAQHAEIDMAWDRLHQAGWRPEQLELRRFTDEADRIQLAARGGPAIFEAVAEMVEAAETAGLRLEVRVRGSWLAGAVPSPP